MELQHHGILGQKWGKRNGPPYPLSRTGDWSAAEKRQQKKNYKEIKKTYNKYGFYRIKKEPEGIKKQISGRVDSTIKKRRNDIQDKLNDNYYDYKNQFISKKTYLKNRDKLNALMDKTLSEYKKETWKLAEELLGEYKDKKLSDNWTAAGVAQMYIQILSNRDATSSSTIGKP